VLKDAEAVAGTDRLSRTLSDLVEAAADAYEATGNNQAMAVARRMRSVTTVPAPAEAGPQPPAIKDLAAALKAMPAGHLSRLIANSAGELTWTGGVFKMPDGFIGRYGYVEIIGPDGLASCPKLRFGLYLQSPDSYYPPHDHAAEEFYYVVGGGARWQIDDGEFFDTRPGSFVHHKPHQRHAMETAAEPLLAMWIWTGDIRTETYRIDGA